MPAPPPVAAQCLDFSHTGPGDSAVTFTGGDAVLQPLPTGITLAACSLSVNGSYYSTANTSVIEWDPTTLAPDPETVALRTEMINPSGFNYLNGYIMPWLPFVPPIVTRSLMGVAEPPRPTVAVQVGSTYFPYAYGSLAARYEPEGSLDIPAASIVAAGGTHGTLQGSHPVIGHALCSGDDDLQSLRIAQSVRRTDVTLADRPRELVQRFRVPEPVELRWIELAVAATPSLVASAVSPPNMPVPPPPPPTVLAVVDPGGAPEPPETMPPALIEAVFAPATWVTYFASMPTPRWASHLDFDGTITLQPGRDYWLYVRSATPYTLLGRMLTGSEGGDFTAGIGAFHTRADSAGPWTAVSDKVLAFKLVGRSAATTPVPPRNEGFLMHVAPNPASDVAQVTWSGAVGTVRCEVFDARGRRVGHGEGGAAGAWAWRVTGRDGRPLPAGVYFVHARDSAGGRIVRQVVIVR
jgi:hypothetical protein